MIDFTTAEEVKVANPRSTKEQAEIKVNADDATFLLSEPLFAKLKLGQHGLKQINTVDSVLLCVVPTEEAVFFKGLTGKNKSRKFKNVSLRDALVSKNIIKGTGKAELETAGINHEGVEYYALINPNN